MPAIAGRGCLLAYARGRVSQGTVMVRSACWQARRMRSFPRAMSLYRKLGAASRSPAVTRPRELGLLDG
jgi:hypothetical protein